MNFGRSHKEDDSASRRTPQLDRQKQSTFRYSSSRSQSERLRREQPQADGGQAIRAMIRIQIAALKVVHAVAIVGFFGIILLFSSLYTAPRLQVNQDDYTYRTEDQYNQQLADLVGSGPLARSKLTINRAEIELAAQKTFPELTNINVSTPLFSSHVVLRADIATPYVLLSSNGRQYVVDSRGIAIAETMRTDLLSLEDQTNAQITVGRPALTSSQMNFIKELEHQSSAKDMAISQMALVAGGGELDVRYEGLGYVVKFNLYGEAREGFGAFIATRDYLGDSQPGEYIDVRVPERSYVK
jgi:hypothetical protein